MVYKKAGTMMPFTQLRTTALSLEEMANSTSKSEMTVTKPGVTCLILETPTVILIAFLKDPLSLKRT